MQYCCLETCHLIFLYEKNGKWRKSNAQFYTVSVRVPVPQRWIKALLHAFYVPYANCDLHSLGRRVCRVISDNLDSRIRIRFHLNNSLFRWMFLPSAELLASFPLMFPALQSSSQVPTSAFYLIKLAINFILLRFEFLFLVSRIRS